MYDVKILHVGTVGIYPYIICDEASWDYDLFIWSRAVPVAPILGRGGIAVDLYFDSMSVYPSAPYVSVYVGMCVMY